MMINAHLGYRTDTDSFFKLPVILHNSVDAQFHWFFIVTTRTGGVVWDALTILEWNYHDLVDVLPSVDRWRSSLCVDTRLISLDLQSVIVSDHLWLPHATYNSSMYNSSVYHRSLHHTGISSRRNVDVALLMVGDVRWSDFWICKKYISNTRRSSDAACI